MSCKHGQPPSESLADNDGRMYYIVYIMETTGTGSPVLQASIQYVLNVALTLPAILYLDKWGRRPSLLLGSFGMMSLLLIVGALEALYGEPFYTDKGPLSALSWKLQDGHDDAGKAIIALSYLFVCTFAVTWGPTSWTYPSEIFPTQVRAKAVSLATASNWLWNCALAFAVPPLLWYINWRMYIVFAAFNGAAFVHMFLTAPETKGKTLEEMNDVFDSGRPAWKGVPKGSRLDALQQEIADGNLKVRNSRVGGVLVPYLGAYTSVPWWLTRLTRLLAHHSRVWRRKNQDSQTLRRLPIVSEQVIMAEVCKLVSCICPSTPLSFPIRSRSQEISVPFSFG